LADDGLPARDVTRSRALRPTGGPGDDTPPSMSLPDAADFVPAEITIVVPTLNERDNVPVLIERIAAALDGIVWEAVIVDDDSKDGTIEVVRSLARRTPRIRGLRRVRRRGLAGASLEGMLASAAPYVALIDADLQHDETRPPRHG
jgi:dolichol-phosphate mannosyltransferase